jgi:MFS family permease
MPYLRFILTHPRVLSFGILLTLFSSFGQTFLISIFVPQMLAEFPLSTVQFGSLYAVATLTSAASLPFFGRLMDRMELRRYTLMVGTGLVVACLTVALAPNVPVLFLGILGLRLTGQGLLSLTASTTMARSFSGLRGRALSVSGLGYPLGEGLLPLLVVLLINLFGWRLSWGILGIVIGVVLLPLTVQLVKGVPGSKEGSLDGDPDGVPDGDAGRQGVRYRDVLRDGRFHALLPGSLCLPFLLTCLFLYQVPLATFKGWTIETMAAAFIGFAAARMMVSLAVGPLIDRVGAVRLFPFYLLPMALGMGVLLMADGAWGAFVFLALAGVSQGCASAILTAMWTEIYGRESIASVKSLVSMLGIFGTALSPVLVGWALQAGVGFSVLLPLFIGMSVMASAFSFPVCMRD